MGGPHRVGCSAEPITGAAVPDLTYSAGIKLNARICVAGAARASIVPEVVREWLLTSPTHRPLPTPRDQGSPLFDEGAAAPLTGRNTPNPRDTV
jgi:hypothetical protein